MVKRANYAIVLLKEIIVTRSMGGAIGGRAFNGEQSRRKDADNEKGLHDGEAIDWWLILAGLENTVYNAF